MHGLYNPINTRIAANGLVLRVHENNLEIFVGRVLIDPVGVQYPQVGTAASHTFFGGGLERTLVFQLVDTLIGWFAFEVFQISMLLKTRASLFN